MTRKKKTTKLAPKPEELSLTNPEAVKAVEGIAGTDEASEAFEAAVAAKVEPTFTVETTETLLGAVEEVSVSVEVKGDRQPFAGVVSNPPPRALKPGFPVESITRAGALALGSPEHGGVRFDRLLSPAKDGHAFGIDPAGPTARITRRGDVWLGHAMYGQAVVTRVRGESQDAVVAELARGIHEAKGPDAEAFRRAVKWGEL